MPAPENRHDRLRDRLAEAMLAGSDALAEQIRGGKAPPGKVKLRPAEQLRQYLLLAQPVESLMPEEAKEADGYWQRFASRSRAEVAEWVLAMEKLRVRMVEGAPRPFRWEMPNPAFGSDGTLSVSGEGELYAVQKQGPDAEVGGFGAGESGS